MEKHNQSEIPSACPASQVKWEPFTRNGDINKMHAELRAHCPVAHATVDMEPFSEVWGLFKYNDIMRAVRETDTFSNAVPRFPSFPRAPLELDPPLHSVFRKLMMPFFGQAYLDGMEPKVREFVQELLAPILAKGEGDLASEFTYPLPIKAVLAFLNLPVEDWELIHRLSEDITNRRQDKERYLKSYQELTEYSAKIMTARRNSPLDPKKDLISLLVTTQIDGQSISDEMIVNILNLILTAGHDSTTSSLGIVINYLAAHPELQEQLRNDPSLIPAATEEVLRLESPVQLMPRVVTRDVEIGGKILKAGETLFIALGSGNRDAEAFENPDEFRLDRNPNRHLVFGQGVHKCIGAPLARLELRVAVEELLKKTKAIKLIGNASRSEFQRYGVLTLPVKLELA